MARSTRPLRYTQQYQINPNLTRGKYYYENFKGGQNPLLYSVSATGIPTLAVTIPGAGVTYRMQTPKGFIWDYFGNTDQAVLPFGVAASGLNISGDLVDNETVEFVPGGNAANSDLAFVTGTDTDFFFRARFLLTDASGSDQFGIGFRKQEAFTAATSFLTTGDALYTDFLLFGFASTKAAANPVVTSSDIANGGSSTVSAVNFTWADGKVHDLEVRVVGRSALTFINGVKTGDAVAFDALGGAITSQATVASAAYTFANALTLVPFIFLRHDVDVNETACIQEVECGHLVDVGKDPNNE